MNRGASWEPSGGRWAGTGVHGAGDCAATIPATSSWFDVAAPAPGIASARPSAGMRTGPGGGQGRAAASPRPAFGRCHRAGLVTWPALRGGLRLYFGGQHPAESRALSGRRRRPSTAPSALGPRLPAAAGCRRCRGHTEKEGGSGGPSGAECTPGQRRSLSPAWASEGRGKGGAGFPGGAGAPQAKE